ncbi:MAG: MFS transporter, partial [Propionibacteriales bacterium]|nr:MFS transporter [Propionibacteriales bacterium]
MTTTTATAPTTATRATSRDWIALVVLMFPVLLVSVDNTVLSLALPELARALAPTAAQQLWMIDAYPLVLAALLLIMGSLGDRIGRRRLLLIGVTGFAVVSALAAFAPTAELLIAARVGLGFFGAMLMPSTLALLRTTFLDDGQRRLAIAVWAATFAAGSALGPLVGGLLLDSTGWWGVVFLLAVPLLLPVLLLGGRVINESASDSPGRIDVLSAVLSALTMAPIVMAIKRVATYGPDLFALALLVVGLVIGYVFVHRQRSLRDPMLDVELFGRPAFSVSVLVNMLSMMAMAGFLFFASQHLQLVIALNPTRAALIMLPGAVAAIIAGLAVVRIVRRVGPRASVVGGITVTATGFAVTALAPVPLPAAILLIAFTCIGIGVGSA